MTAVDTWLAELVTMKRQQRRLEAMADSQTGNRAGRGIRWLEQRAWLDRYQRGEFNVRPKQPARLVRRMTPEQRLAMYEQLEPGTTVIAYPRSGGGVGGVLTYSPDRPSGTGTGRVTAVHRRQTPPA